MSQREREQGLQPEERHDDPAIGQAGETPPQQDVAGPAEPRCINHPGRPTLVSCSSCGSPLCPDCMVYSAVGIKCAQCSRLPRSARVTIKRGRLLRAVAAALVAGTAVGFAYYYILGAIGFFFFFFFVAVGIGYVMGEAVARASGRYRGTLTAVIAAAGTVWAFVFPPFLAALINLGAGWTAVVFAFSGRGIINWLVMAFAAYLAWSRNR